MACSACGTSCTCLLLGTERILVTGLGSETAPYIVAWLGAVSTSTPCLGASGLGTSASPLSVSAIISTDLQNRLFCSALSGGLSVIPPSSSFVERSNCIVGSGITGSPLVVFISSTPGNSLSCSAQGLLAVDNRATPPLITSGCLAGNGVGVPLEIPLATNMAKTSGLIASLFTTQGMQGVGLGSSPLDVRIVPGDPVLSTFYGTGQGLFAGVEPALSGTVGVISNLSGTGLTPGQSVSGFTTGSFTNPTTRTLEAIIYFQTLTGSSNITAAGGPSPTSTATMQAYLGYVAPSPFPIGYSEVGRVTTEIVGIPLTLSNRAPSFVEFSYISLAPGQTFHFGIGYTFTNDATSTVSINRPTFNVEFTVGFIALEG
jgi:hypothetical protein